MQNDANTPHVGPQWGTLCGPHICSVDAFEGVTLHLPEVVDTLSVRYPVAGAPIPGESAPHATL
jgi:hypothetical protein